MNTENNKFKKSGKLIISNFWANDPHDLYESDIGWLESDLKGACSDDPERVFRYYIEIVGFNMAFYYIDDGCFYNIFTEQLPVNVYRMLPDPDWDGGYVIYSAIGAGESHYDGEVIYTTNDVTSIWGELKIGGKPIGEVLERSVILTLD